MPSELASFPGPRQNEATSELVSLVLSVSDNHSMDICSWFGASSSKSAPIVSSSESEPEDSEVECLEPSPPKRHCSVVVLKSAVQSHIHFQANGHTIRNGKKTFLGWNMMKIIKEFGGEQEEHGSPNPSTTGKRQQKK